MLSFREVYCSTQSTLSYTNENALEKERLAFEVRALLWRGHKRSAGPRSKPKYAAFISLRHQTGSTNECVTYLQPSHFRDGILHRREFGFYLIDDDTGT